MKFTFAKFFAGTCVLMLLCGSVAAWGDQKGGSYKFYAKLLQDTVKFIHENYVTSADLRQLVHGAIKGMMLTLDTQSEFLTPDEARQAKAESEGVVVGIGVELAIRDGNVLLTHILDGSPAEEAGLAPGDRILAVDGTPLRSPTRENVLSKLLNFPGTAVHISIERRGEKLLDDIKLIRRAVGIPAVRDAEVFSGGVGYVRLAEFNKRAPRDLERELSRLRAQGANSFILDLRGNSGGPLQAAAEVAELFLDRSDVIVRIRSRTREREQIIRSNRQGIFSEDKLAVLIDAESASASEIVAAALRDQAGAGIFGVPSFGKGSVQVLHELADGSALRITTAEYLTPSGLTIDRVGIIPDGQINKPAEQLEKAILYLTGGIL